MKKVLSLLCAIILVVSLVPSAFAANEKNKLPTLREYSFDGAMDIAMNLGWDGKVHKLPKVGMKIWLSSILKEVELSQEDEDDGYRYAYQTEDGGMILTVTSSNLGMSTKEFLSELKAAKFQNIGQITLNKADCVLYIDPTVEDYVCRVASFVQDDGSVTEFVFYYVDIPELALLTETCVASIRPLA